MLGCKCKGFALELLENEEPLTVYEQGKFNDQSHMSRKIIVAETARLGEGHCSGSEDRRSV